MSNAGKRKFQGIELGCSREGRIHQASHVALTLVFGVALFTLLAWQAGWRSVLVVGHAPPMMPNAALCFLLIALGFIAAFHGSPRTAFVLAGVVAAVVLATAAEYTWNVSLGIDELIAVDQFSAVLRRGRMAVNTIADFLCLAIATVLFALPPTRSRLGIAGTLVATSLAIDILTFIGYAGHLDLASSWGRFTSMAPMAAANFTLLSAAVLCVGIQKADRIAGELPWWVAAQAFVVIGIVTFGMFVAVRYRSSSRVGTLSVLLLVGGFVLATSLGWAIHLLRQVRMQLREVAGANERLREMHENLEIVRNRLEFAIAGTSDGIWDFDVAEGRMYWSPRYKQLLGYEDEELTASPEQWRALVHPDDLPAVTQQLQEHLDGKTETYCVRYRMRHKNGSYRWILSRARSLRDDNGEARRMAGSHADVTADVEAEQRLKYQSELLAITNAEMEQFAYIASHDLQEPLRMVASYTQLLAQRYSQNLDERGLRYIRFATDGATRMQTLITDLLTFSRVGRREMSIEPISIRNAVDEALDNLRLKIERSGARITVGELPVIPADHTQMVQLFQNLVSNALKFHGDERPRIDIYAVAQGEEWRFSVRDNGIGLDPAYAERVFVAFHRLHTRAEYEGNGIGLAICKKIVTRHGGQIWVDSQLGRGATFYFNLPSERSWTIAEKEGLDAEPIHAD